MHGAGGGAPRGNRNAWKHGETSGKARALRKQIAELVWIVARTMTEIE
jgi:hypothetical protein